MSQKCKNLEEKANILFKTAPLKAKDEFIKAAKCYEKNFKKKNYKKLMVKAAKILETHAKPLDPFETRSYLEEASKIYNKINQKDAGKSVMIRLGNKFVNFAKKIEKSNLNLVKGIKYYLAAEDIFLQNDEEDKYHECTISVYNICVSIGIPLGRISKYLKSQPN